MDRFIVSLPRSSTLLKKRPSASASASASRDNTGSSISSGIKKKKATAVQMFIDLGQKSFGSTVTCKACSMLYLTGDVEDEERHNRYCKKAQRGAIPSLTGYKVIKVYTNKLVDDGKIICLTMEQLSKLLSSTAASVMKEIQGDIGNSSEFLSGSKHGEGGPQYVAKAYLYIYGDDLEVAGMLISEQVDRRCTVVVDRGTDISTIMVKNDDAPVPKLSPIPPTAGDSEHDAAIATICREIHLGIRLIWVKSSFRGMKFATALVDCARQTFLFSSIVTRREIAFSQPTSQGFAFALDYTKQDSIRVYA